MSDPIETPHAYPHPHSMEFPHQVDSGSPALGATRDEAPAPAQQTLRSRLEPGETWGLTLTLIGFLSLAIYLGWLMLPDAFLNWVDITFYPSKYWAVAVPGWILVTYLWSQMSYFVYCWAVAPPLDSWTTLRDKHTQDLDVHRLADFAAPLTVRIALADMPVSHVNALLFDVPDRPDRTHLA